MYQFLERSEFLKTIEVLLDGQDGNGGRQ